MKARPLAPVPRGAQASAGFSLMELVVVLVLVGILSAVAIPRITNTNALTLDVQSRTLASTLLSAQVVAYSTGKNVTFCTGGGAYWAQYQYVNNALTTCPASAPASSPPLPTPMVLSNGVSFTATPSSPLTFTSLGQPTASTDTSYTLGVIGSSTTYTATIATLTGFVSLNPP